MSNQNPATAVEAENPAAPGLFDLLKLAFTKQGSRYTPDAPEDEDKLEAPAAPAPRTLISQPQPFRTVSEKGLKLIKEFEGCKLKAYRCPAGVWTIGYGWTQGVKPGMVWTMQKAEEMLVEGVKPYAATVAKAIGKASTTQGEFDALVSFCYNAGEGNFKKSSMLKFHVRGLKSMAANAFLRWTKARVRGKMVTLKGLVRRREAERALYLS